MDTIHAGVWSVIPALVAISLAWYSRDAIIGLFAGIASAGVVYGALKPGSAGVPKHFLGDVLIPKTSLLHTSFGPITAGNVLGGIFGLKHVPTIIATSPMFSDPWYVENVLLAIFAIGGVIGLMIRSGALRGVLEALTARTDSPADAEKAAFLAGIIIHIDDYFNCLVVGSMMRPLTDKYNVSRAKLAYYVDSAGSPAARLAFYSTWGAALIGFIGKALVQAQKQDKLPDGMTQYVAGQGDKAHAVTNQIWPLFFNSIFFGFYSWAALIIAGLVAWQVVPNIMGMRDEESRARNGGGVVGDDHEPMISDEIDEYEMADTATPDWRNFAIPILTMIIVGLSAMFWRGSPVIQAPHMNTLFSLGGYHLVLPGSGKWSFNIGGVQLGLASFSALVVAFVLYRVKGDIPSNKDATEAMTRGFKGILLAAVILMFASSIQNAVSLLDISSFVTNNFSGVPPQLVPVSLFLITSMVSFSDGSSWSTYGIMFPIAIPIAFTTGANLPLVMGAVFSGGIFGDHSSPISDTTVLASSTSGSDHLVHVRTQIPYAVICATIAAVLFLTLGFFLPGSFRIFPY